MSAPAGSAAPGAPPQVVLGSAQGRWVLLAAVLGSSVAMLDSTVVNVALPTLGDDLGASMAGLQWVVNGYTLALASLILLGGSLGDRFGRRRVFVVGVVWFALASLLCGLAPDTVTLVGARVLQGVGGALLTPGSLAIIQATYVRADRARAIGAWSALGGVATAIGPFLGGWLVEAVGWRWIFLINLPLAAVVAVVAVRHVPETSDPEAVAAGGGFDVVGAVLGAVGLAGVTYALVAAGEGIGATVVVSGAVGVSAFVAFVVAQRREAHPLVPLEIFSSRQFTGSNLATLVVYAGLGALFFLLVLQLQVVAGFGAIAAGTALLPITVIMLLLSSRAGDLAQRIGPRLPMTLGPLVAAAGTVLLLRVGPEASYVGDVLPGVTVLGFGLALTVAPLTATVLGAVEDRHAGVASGVNNAVARAGGLLAVAALPTFVGLTGDAYDDPAVFDAGFRASVVVCAVLFVLGAVISLVLVRKPVEDAEESTPSAGPAGQPTRPGEPTRTPARGGAAVPAGERSRERTPTCCPVGAPPLAPRREAAG